MCTVLALTLLTNAHGILMMCPNGVHHAPTVGFPTLMSNPPSIQIWLPMPIVNHAPSKTMFDVPSIFFHLSIYAKIWVSFLSWSNCFLTSQMRVVFGSVLATLYCVVLLQPILVGEVSQRVKVHNSRTLQQLQQGTECRKQHPHQKSQGIAWYCELFEVWT